MYEEVENNQKWTESQFIKYRKDHLGHINECLKVVQEKLVRSSAISYGSHSCTVTVLWVVCVAVPALTVIFAVWSLFVF